MMRTRLLSVCPCFDITWTTRYNTSASCKEADHKPNNPCDRPAVRLRNSNCLGIRHHGIRPIWHWLRDIRLRLDGITNTIATGRSLGPWIIGNRLCHRYWIVLSIGHRNWIILRIGHWNWIILSIGHWNWMALSICHRCHRSMGHRYWSLRSREAWIHRRRANTVASHVV